jgi:hypothetical protein
MARVDAAEWVGRETDLNAKSKGRNLVFSLHKKIVQHAENHGLSD